jgi:hypothetical protein
MKHIAQFVQIAEKSIILKGADSLSAKGFTQVPNHILKSTKISPGAKLSYAMLLSYAWQNDFCFPGQARLATDMGVSLRTANTYIQELEEKGYIKIKRRGQGRPNLYVLCLRKDIKSRKKEPVLHI